MSRQLARDVLVIAGLGGLVWYAFSRAKSSGAFDPTSDQNLAYKAASSATSWFTGIDSSPGTVIYDATHRASYGTDLLQATDNKGNPAGRYAQTIFVMDSQGRMTGGISLDSAADKVASGAYVWGVNTALGYNDRIIPVSGYKSKWDKVRESTGWLSSVLSIASIL